MLDLDKLEPRAGHASGNGPMINVGEGEETRSSQSQSDPWGLNGIIPTYNEVEDSTDDPLSAASLHLSIEPEKAECQAPEEKNPHVPQAASCESTPPPLYRAAPANNLNAQTKPPAPVHRVNLQPHTSQAAPPPVPRYAPLPNNIHGLGNHYFMTPHALGAPQVFLIPVQPWSHIPPPYYYAAPVIPPVVPSPPPPPHSLNLPSFPPARPVQKPVPMAFVAVTDPSTGRQTRTALEFSDKDRAEMHHQLLSPVSDRKYLSTMSALSIGNVETVDRAASVRDREEYFLLCACTVQSQIRRFPGLSFVKVLAVGDQQTRSVSNGEREQQYLITVWIDIPHGDIAFEALMSNRRNISTFVICTPASSDTHPFARVGMGRKFAGDQLDASNFDISNFLPNRLEYLEAILEAAPKALRAKAVESLKSAGLYYIFAERLREFGYNCALVR